MATTFTVANVYDQICEVLCEPRRAGTCPGLQLGIVTQQDFLDLFGVVLADFLNKTGLSLYVFTQAINYNQSQYMSPNDMNSITACFVAGIYIDHATNEILDDWVYGWQTKMGQPEYWHEDGLPVKTIELALNPNYSGTPVDLPLPIDPEDQPPYGTYGTFCTPSDGNLTMVGSAGIDDATFVLADIIPLVPDSFCYALSYGVLAELFSGNAECKDEQRAMYCNARYQESIKLAAAVGGQMFYGGS